MSRSAASLCSARQYKPALCPPTSVSRARGSWIRRYTANARTMSCTHLLGAMRPAAREEAGVGRGVELIEVDEDRRDGSARAVQVGELPPVELRVGEAEPHRGRGDRELAPSFEHRRGGARFPPPEVLRVGDVVVV